MGLGKQQPVSSYVATPNSFRRIGELQIGDEIFGRDGNVYAVSGVFPQKERRVFKVTFSDGVSCECGPEHRWCVRDVNRRRKGKGWITKTTQEIMDSGVTYNLKGFGHNHTRRKWEIPMCEPVKYKERLYIIHPYIMGVLLGDGHLCGGNGKLSFSTPDMDCLLYTSCYRDFLAVRRFIKCNFGLYDNMIDIDENWNFKFEFVGCPLRVECDGFKKICEPKFNSTLSDCQLRVMELCYYGKKDEEIAEALFISSHTVKNHRKNVFRKLSIHSMAEFMRYANEKNLFKSE